MTETLFDWVANIVATFDWPDVVATDPTGSVLWQLMLGFTACAVLLIIVKTVAKLILNLFA